MQAYCRQCAPVAHLSAIRAKNFNSLQSYVRAIRVETRKQQKWFGGDIMACWPLQD